MLTTDASSTKSCHPGYPWLRIFKKEIWTRSTYESKVFTRCIIFFFFFRSTLLMLNEMDCPSYWNNSKLSVRIWQLKTHGHAGRKSFGRDYWHIGGAPSLSVVGAWNVSQEWYHMISHESLGIPNQTERAVYTTYQLLSGVWLFAAPLTVCCPPGSSAHGILQVRTLEWVSTSSSRGSSWPEIEPRSPELQADSLPSEHGSPQLDYSRIRRNQITPE